MVSPGELRTLDQLVDQDAFEPEIADDGTVSFSDVAQYLDEQDGDPSTILERYTARGTLVSEFVSKVYVCPTCSTEGMQYTTICPACESPHISRTVVLEHICGHLGPESQFEDDEGYSCSSCEGEMTPENTEQLERYSCNECSEICETPDDRLWCRDCFSMTPTLEASERLLYRYALAPGGEQWIARQKYARETIANALEERGFETEIDATITDGSRSYPVHVSATDSLLGEKRMVNVYETPTSKDVESFCAFVDLVGGHPIVITTSGTAEEEVVLRAESSELTLLTFGNGGTLETDYEIAERSTTQEGFFQRLTTILEVPGRNGQR
jgi:hypothetical protein